MYSETSHTTPTANIIPIYGGKCVTVLKTGTETIIPRPKYSIVLLLNKRCADSSSAADTLILPRKGLRYEAMIKGNTKHKIEGNTTNSISPAAETFLAIQSMVVVTSPIGDQAPPALAAITTIEAYHIRSPLSLINLRNKVTNTIVAVKLSIMAESTKARIPIIQSNDFLLSVFTALLSTSNPRCRSMISTMVMAPIRNINISAVLPK